MRRLLLAIVVSAGALLPASAPAAAPPSLLGDNTIKATGSRVITVTIPKRLGVMWYDPIWNGGISTNGTYGGYALMQLTPRNQGRILLVMQMRHPAGCRQDGSGCSPIRIRYLKGPSDGGRVNMSSGMTTVLEAGTYRLYAFTDPGKTVTAGVDLKGLTGKRALTATSPAYMHVVQSLPAATGGAGYESKKLTATLGNRGLVIGGVWVTPSNGVQADDPSRTAGGGVAASAVTQCWERKGSAQDPMNTCGYGTGGAGAQPDVHVDNHGLGRPLHGWRSAGVYSYAYNVAAVSQPLGRYGAYAMWWTTG